MKAAARQIYQSASSYQNNSFDAAGAVGVGLTAPAIRATLQAASAAPAVQLLKARQGLFVFYGAECQAELP